MKIVLTESQYKKLLNGLTTSEKKDVIASFTSDANQKVLAVLLALLGK